MLRLLEKFRWLEERSMSADFKKLEERVENTIRPDSLVQAAQETYALVRSLGELFNRRFDQIDGKLADIDSNMMEMRNLLAFLVEKQK